MTSARHAWGLLCHLLRLPLTIRASVGKGPCPSPLWSPAQRPCLQTHPSPHSACVHPLRAGHPFQELPNQACNWSAGLLQWLGVPNILLQEVPDLPPEYYSCQFKVSKLSR